MTDDRNSVRSKCRRALEALRNGVPNGDAIAALGCNQPGVQTTFDSLLSQVSNETYETSTGLGMLAAGDFGSGKSHLLGYLESQALDKKFVCSRVVISKETPLFNMEKVFSAAVENAKAPGVTGQMVQEVAHNLDFNSDSYARFFAWASREDNTLHRILPATLMVYEKHRQPELLNEITWFWSGEKIAVKRVRDGLRDVGQVQSYAFRAPTAKDLPSQKLRFVLELIKAAGYRGWVVLMDEIELVANYSLLQRARSYAELARWMGRASGEDYPGLVVVGTITGDFASVVLDEKEDRDKAAERLRQRGREEDIIAAARADTGMRLIERDVHSLEEPDDEMLFDLYRRLKGIHSEGYDWVAPDIDHRIGQGGRRRIRTFIRRWINGWDLRRLYPESEPDIEEIELEFRYDEDRDLEKEIQERDGHDKGPGLFPDEG